MKLYYCLRYSPFMCLAFVLVLSLPACAQDAERPGHRLQALREMLANKKENEALGAHSQNVAHSDPNGTGRPASFGVWLRTSGSEWRSIVTA